MPHQEASERERGRRAVTCGHVDVEEAEAEAEAEAENDEVQCLFS